VDDLHLSVRLEVFIQNSQRLFECHSELNVSRLADGQWRPVQNSVELICGSAIDNLSVAELFSRTSSISA
jgi:hypothetical protein